MAAEIDARLARALRTLDAGQVDHVLRSNPITDEIDLIPGVKGEVFNLSVQTLLRGRDADLTSAEDLHAEMQKTLSGTLGELSPVVDHDALTNVASDELKGFLRSSDACSFVDNTPLWYYCLRESACAGTQGHGFGPMTSRVIMETVYRAICEDSDGILACPPADGDPVPRPELTDGFGRFGLQQLIDFCIERFQLTTKGVQYAINHMFGQKRRQ